MRTAKVESIGLEGAQILGDRKVASLLQFSWSARHDSSAGLSRRKVRRQKKGRRSK
jgi:hypothetical protein